MMFGTEMWNNAERVRIAFKTVGPDDFYLAAPHSSHDQLQIKWTSISIYIYNIGICIYMTD